MVVLLALGRSASAQVAAPEPVTEPAIAPALEKRLTEELAARGIVLARHHVGLLIEPRGEHCSVSLFDLATGRPAAATEIDRLPANPDEAIALLVRSVIALDIAIDPQRAAEPRATAPEPGASSPLPPTLLARRRASQALFRRYSLRFAPSYDLGARQEREIGDNWQVYRGRVDEELDPQEFYRMVGRDDLARAYQRRQALMLGGYVVAGVAFGAAAVIYFRRNDPRGCDPASPQFDQCSRDRILSNVPGIVAGAVGVAGGLFGTYFFRNPHPIDENDAKTLADAYNQRLRGQLGLPVAGGEPLVRELAVSPVVGSASRGVALAGRF
jgi:hypothetical protein